MRTCTSCYDDHRKWKDWRQALSATEKAIVEVRDLSKVFEDVRAVDGVDFDIYQGELFGFLGPNGAGKTTTINMLTGLARPTSGSVKI